MTILHENDEYDEYGIWSRQGQGMTRSGKGLILSAREDDGDEEAIYFLKAS